MQKYQPRVKITSLEGVDKGTTHHFSFPETVFIAVTAYQSDKVAIVTIYSDIAMYIIKHR